MTIYSEVLRMALASDDVPGSPEATVPQLVARLDAQRSLLPEDAGAPGDLVERMALELAHDVALVRLCGALGIEEHLTAPAPPLDERTRLLRLVEEDETFAAQARAGWSATHAQVGVSGGADASSPMYSESQDLRP